METYLINRVLSRAGRIVLGVSFTVLGILPAVSQPRGTAIQQVRTPEWSKNLSIYEVNLRQFTPSGTLKEFEAHIPRLKEMGVGIIWFMPIHPIGERNRKGSLGSYYSVRDFRAVDPAYGSMEEFVNVVKKIHEQGMFVIIDWVANHSAWDNVLLPRHPDYYEKDDKGQFKSPFDWTDVIEFNYDNPEMRKYMTNSLKFWVEKANIDGFRCDVADMVPLDFWINARKELDEIKPVFMLAEAEKPETHQAFDMTYAWDMHHLMNKIAKKEKQAADIWQLTARQDSAYPFGAYRMNFITNHDENSWNGTEFERMGQGVEAFAILATTLPGMNLLYSGQEAPLTKRLAFFDRDPIDWKDYGMRAFYRTLNELKRDNPALWNGSYGGQVTRLDPGNPNIITFSRELNGRKVLVLLNLSDQEQDFQLETKRLAGSYTEVFMKAPVTFKVSEKFHLKPWEYRVFTR